MAKWTCPHCTPAPKKKVEFSKRLAQWAAAMATAAAAASYILSAVDKQPVSDLSTAVFGACTGYLITYAAKSLGEKMSRNKHGLDADGSPFASGGEHTDD